MAATETNTNERGAWARSDYSITRERAWHLSILVGHETQAWAVHAIENGEVAALGWSADGSALDAAELPVNPVTVSFITLPEWSTLVPEGALEPGTEALHLGLVFGGLPTGALRDERVADLGATCIYVHDDETERNVLDRYPSARPLPMQGLMVRSALARSSNGATMVLHRGHHSMEVAMAKENRLLLSNTYPARTSQDLLYYALLAAEGSSVKASEVHVHHGGTHFTDHDRDLLRRFFGKEESAVGMSAEATSAEVGTQRWLALLEQFACVS